MARFNSSTSFANFAESFSWVTSAAISRQGRLGRETAGFNITDPLEAAFFVSCTDSIRASARVRSGSFDPLSPASGHRSGVDNARLTQFRQLFPKEVTVRHAGNREDSTKGTQTEQLAELTGVTAPVPNS